MSPATHFLASWAIAERWCLSRRERLVVTLAGVLPDLDGLGIVVDLFNRSVRRPESAWFQQYHHVLLHGLVGAVVIALLAFAVCPRRARVLMLGLFAVHLHFLCDLLGSRGPSSDEIWSIAYLAPVSNSWNVEWTGQWALNGWQNLTITGVLLARAIYCAVRSGSSPVSLFSERVDARIVETLQSRCRCRSPGLARTRHLPESHACGDLGN